MPGFVSSISNSNEAVFANNADFTGSSDPTEVNGLRTNGKLWIGSTAVNVGGTHINVGSLTSPDGSITFGYNNPDITAIVTGGAPYISLSPYIVGSDVHSGFATIASAITQAVVDGASSTNPKNVYIKPKNGGYTENLTLSDGINLIGFGESFFSGICTTKIIGKMTMTAAGNTSITNLVLQTNGDYVVEVTGASALNVILTNCYINATNANAFHCTNGSAGIQLFKCQGSCGNNTYFVCTGGGINVYNSVLTALTPTASTFTNTSLTIENTNFGAPITTSGASGLTMNNVEILLTNITCLTVGAGTTGGLAFHCRFASGNASAVSIAGELNMINTAVNSTNANAITGAGTLFYAFVSFYGSGASSTVNTSTVTPLATLI